MGQSRSLKRWQNKVKRAFLWYEEILERIYDYDEDEYVRMEAAMLYGRIWDLFIESKKLGAIDGDDQAIKLQQCLEDATPKHYINLAHVMDELRTYKIYVRRMYESDLEELKLKERHNEVRLKREAKKAAVVK